MLDLRKSAPKAMVYGEVGRHEIKFTVWKRMKNVWKKDTKCRSINCRALFFVDNIIKMKPRNGIWELNKFR